MSTAEQARALIGLRARLFSRRLSEGGRAVFLVLGMLLFGALSAGLSLAVLQLSEEVAATPQAVEARGGATALFATWLGLALVARLWFGMISAGQDSSWFLDPARFKQWPVSQRLLSAVNFLSLLFEPVWLVLYPVLVCMAVGISRFPGAPGVGSLLTAEFAAVLATVGVLHLGSAVGASFDARPMVRRVLSILFAFTAFAGFQVAADQPQKGGLARLLTAHREEILRLSPPGWAAGLAQALADGQPGRALLFALVLCGIGVGCAVAAHALSQREILRPTETRAASPGAARGAGWELPAVGAIFSALFEKEMKTVLRVGWLQLVLVPVAFLLLRVMMTRSSLGAHPLMVAAAYAHLGVLDLTTNAFGRDVEAARAYFLWPVSRRRVLAAKNAVAYTFSLMIFALLAGVAFASGQVPRGELPLALLAHAATFPLLATVGNLVSSYAPSPVRGLRLRRVRGAGPFGARLGATALMMVGAWAPWAVAALLSLPRGLVYAGEFLAMLVAYGGLLGFAAHILDRRKEALLAALKRDE